MNQLRIEGVIMMNIYRVASIVIVILLISGCVSAPVYTTEKTREQAFKEESWNRTAIRPSSPKYKTQFVEDFKANSLYQYYIGSADLIENSAYQKGWSAKDYGEVALAFARTSSQIFGAFGLIFFGGNGVDVEEMLLSGTSVSLMFPNTSMLKVLPYNADLPVDILAYTKEVEEIMKAVGRNCNPVMPYDQGLENIWFYYEKGEILREDYVCDPPPPSVGSFPYGTRGLAHYLGRRRAYGVSTTIAKIQDEEGQKIILSIIPRCGIEQRYDDRKIALTSYVDDKGWVKLENYTDIPNYSTDVCRLPDSWGAVFLEDGWIRFDRIWEEDVTNNEYGYVILTDKKGSKILPAPIKYPGFYIKYQKSKSEK